MKKILIFIFLLSLLTSCKNEPHKKEEIEKNIPEDFNAFYNHFLTDSSYQVSRILFPLKGLPDRASNKVKWRIWSTSGGKI